jgi:hypothetical protein
MKEQFLMKNAFKLIIIRGNKSKNRLIAYALFRSLLKSSKEDSSYLYFLFKKDKVQIPHKKDDITAITKENS